MRIPFSDYDFFGYLAAGLVLIMAVDYGFDRGWLANTEPELVPATVCIFIAYVLGHAVAHLSWTLLEENFVRKVLRSPEETLFQERQETAWRYVFPGFYKPFPPETRDRILRRAKPAGFDKPGRALFFHCHPVVMRQEACRTRLSTFLNLYGFARNVSFASLFAAVVLVIAFFRQTPASQETLAKDMLLWATAAIFVAIVMFYRYLKFFRFYTAEVFRTYAETPEAGQNAGC